MHSQLCIAKGIAKYAKIGKKNVKNALSYDTKVIIRKTQNLVNNLLGLQNYQKCENATRNCSNKVPKMVQKEECSLNNKYLKFGTED